MTAYPLPPLSDPRWRELVTGQRKVAVEFLALKIFLWRAGMAVAKDSSPSKVQVLVTELHDLCQRSAQLKSVQGDLQKIFG